MPESSKPVIFILNGPNLNLLGKRQPEVYGHRTLDDIAALCADHARAKGYDISFRQSNHEGDYIDWLHQARDEAAGVILNPAAWTHTSIAIMDALLAYDGPAIEVHLSNIHQRESFRHVSWVSKAVNGGIFGLGFQGYILAIDAIDALLAEQQD